MSRSFDRAEFEAAINVRWSRIHCQGCGSELGAGASMIDAHVQMRTLKTGTVLNESYWCNDCQRSNRDRENAA